MLKLLFDSLFRVKNNLFENEFAAGEYVGVGDFHLFKLFPVEKDLVARFHLSAGILCDHGERFSARESQSRFGHLGRSENVFAAAWIDGIEAHRRENIPRAHLSAVFVAADSVGSRPV